MKLRASSVNFAPHTNDLGHIVSKLFAAQW